MAKVLGYYAVFTPLSFYLSKLAREYFQITPDSIGEYIILGVNMLANLITEFLFYKYVVFTDAKPAKEKEEN